ncbi:hypothetical protein [Methylomonas rapida]|uniref:Uncharacterized protein n=1 Tax=Methylomonas rapida TaxID=2963939 RepID=A0ABY7GQZ1_9GAMM|nr:hypothetical protein [Methylomonas rapida]WAR46941.1 hypothetical protein NM686_010640 [Methylomonas rapida]
MSRKDDQGKLDWTLIPWKGLRPVVRVLEFGLWHAVCCLLFMLGLGDE